jgi:N-acetylglucosaminyldiphosphoundecaprenol N-acetyl-beta-D-mannosaminyltransferase
MKTIIKTSNDLELFDMKTDARQTNSVLRASIDILTWDTAISRISDWAASHESRYVCMCNVHSIVTADQDKSFGKILNEADMATPDGAPVAWLLKRLGFDGQQRINGPDLMWKYFEKAALRDESIFLYGGKQTTLDLLNVRIKNEFPNLKIAGSYSPPFRYLSREEDNAVVEMINSSGAGTVWVSLGCPSQEKWMARHRGRINAVMLGVGAAFNYHAGTTVRAPVWMQNAGLEWFHRLVSEPKRLWKRYLMTNSLFIIGATKQLLLSQIR